MIQLDDLDDKILIKDVFNHTWDVMQVDDKIIDLSSRLDEDWGNLDYNQSPTYSILTGLSENLYNGIHIKDSYMDNQCVKSEDVEIETYNYIRVFAYTDARQLAPARLKLTISNPNDPLSPYIDLDKFEYLPLFSQYSNWIDADTPIYVFLPVSYWQDLIERLCHGNPYEIYLYYEIFSGGTIEKRVTNRSYKNSINNILVVDAEETRGFDIDLRNQWIPIP